MRKSIKEWAVYFYICEDVERRNFACSTVVLAFSYEHERCSCYVTSLEMD
jgi:hypothetical protein